MFIIRFIQKQKNDQVVAICHEACMLLYVMRRKVCLLSSMPLNFAITTSQANREIELILIDCTTVFCL